MKRVLSFTFGALLTGALALLAMPASASLIFNLDVDSCTGTCGPAGTLFGTVTLTEVDADTVHVDVELTPDAVTMFVVTGAGYSLTWNGPSGETLEPGTLSAGFTFLGEGSYSTGGPFGTFNYAVDCVSGGVACPGNGGGGAATSTLMFDVTHSPTLALTDFAATNPQGYYFTVDLIGPNGRTGVVGANTHTGSGDCTPGTPECTPTVPEPGTLALLALAMVGGAVVGRKRLGASTFRA